MTIMNKIRAVLDDRLVNTPSIPPIAFQNVSFDPDVTQTYVRAYMVPTYRQPAVRGLNPQQRYQGLYKMLICTPEAIGVGTALDLADVLLARFEATTDMTFNGQTISIEYVEAGASYLNSPHFCTPVTAAWYTYA